MTAPRPTPGEHDIPVFQPGQPTPDDPRKEAPIKDPPPHQEHDRDRKPPVRQAEAEKASGARPPDASPDRVIYDESRALG